MIKKIYFIFLLAIIVIISFVGFMNINNIVFTFDRKVDNDFINNYTITYSTYFKELYAIDSVSSFGCAAEQRKDYIYFFKSRF